MAAPRHVEHDARVSMVRIERIAVLRGLDAVTARVATLLYGWRDGFYVRRRPDYRVRYRHQ